MRIRKPLITRQDLTFNDFLISNYMVIESIERNSVIGVTNYLSDIPSKTGQLLLGHKRNAKLITIYGRIYGNSWFEIEKTASLIAAHLATNEPKELKARDSLLTDLVIFDGEMELTRKNNTAEIIINFINLSGLRYGDKHELILTPENTIKVYNTGTTNADLKITGSAISEKIIIENKSNQTTMQIINVTVNEKFELNSADKTCTGDSVRKGLTLTSDWINLLPGENEIYINGAEAKISWRDTWM